MMSHFHSTIRLLQTFERRTQLLKRLRLEIQLAAFRAGHFNIMPMKALKARLDVLGWKCTVCGAVEGELCQIHVRHIETLTAGRAGRHLSRNVEIVCEHCHRQAQPIPWLHKPHLGRMAVNLKPVA